MPDLLLWLYLTNAVLLINHEIDSAYWKEWDLFRFPGGLRVFYCYTSQCFSLSYMVCSNCKGLCFRLYFFFNLMFWGNLCLCNSYVFLETRAKGIQQTNLKANSLINAIGITCPVDCHFIYNECITTGSASTRTGNSAALHYQPVLRSGYLSK